MMVFSKSLCEKLDEYICRGRLAQSGEHPPTMPAVRVQIQMRLSLRPWQKKAQPGFFELLIRLGKTGLIKSGSYTLLDYVKGNLARTNWLYGACT